KTLPLLRASIGLANEPETLTRFRDACWARIWGADGPRDLGKSDEIRDLCVSIDIDPERVLAMKTDAKLKDAVVANTEEAVQRGAFGAPTYFVADEMFFGHDRLDYVEERL
ncbi:MAG: DsbA family protein, partial [Pseudomonadota bacterium]